MAEAHNALKCLLADKTNLPKPRHHLQGRPREMEPGLLPKILNPRVTEPKHLPCPQHSAPPLHPRTAPRAAVAEEPTPTMYGLKHIVLDLAQELLGIWVTWKLPLGRESNTATNTTKEWSNRKTSYMGNTTTSSSTLINYLLDMKQGMLFFSFLAFFIFLELIPWLLYNARTLWL